METIYVLRKMICQSAYSSSSSRENLTVFLPASALLVRLILLFFLFMSLYVDDGANILLV